MKSKNSCNPLRGLLAGIAIAATSVIVVLAIMNGFGLLETIDETAKETRYLVIATVGEKPFEHWVNVHSVSYGVNDKSCVEFDDTFEHDGNRKSVQVILSNYIVVEYKHDDLKAVLNRYVDLIGLKKEGEG